MFDIPPFDICKKYEKEILDIEKRFNSNNKQIHNILQHYIEMRKSASDSITPLRIPIFFPYWFSENHDLNNDIRQKVILAGVYYSEYILLQDILIDEKQGKLELDIAHINIISNIFLTSTMEILADIFSSNFSFWVNYRKYIMEYWNSIYWEKKYCSKLNEWGDKEIRMLGKKFSPLKTAAYAFSILSDQQWEIPFFERLIEHFHIGIQILDDIDDWKEDLKNKHYSYFLCECAVDIEENNENDLNSGMILDEVPKRALFRTLNKSLFFFHKANKIANDLHLKSLNKFISIYFQATNNLVSISLDQPRTVLEKGATNLLLYGKTI